MSQNPFVVFKETFREEYAKQMRRTSGKSATVIASPDLEAAELETGKLKANFQNAMVTLSEMFTSAERNQYGNLQIDTMEVNLEVSAEGKLAFLGSGGRLSGKTSFKLLFKKRP